jgi:hypothetical protein
MTNHSPSAYGDAFADVYDRWYANITDGTATASFMASRALPELPVLELGVGTGRLVGPMVKAGLKVVGVDASAAMLDVCRRAYPNTQLIQADLASFVPAQPVGGALCAFNTLFNLTDHSEQQQLFSAVGNALGDGAPLVIEAITGFGLDQAPAQSAGFSEVDPERTVISATVVDSAAQIISGQHLEFLPDNSVKKRSWLLRWSTTEQMDQMAEKAGLKLTERYADWDQTPSGTDNEKHISVYQRA